MDKIINSGYLALSALSLAACLSSCSENKDRQRPNILFFIADDASYNHFSAYGECPWMNTPGFDKVAREGILFDNCYTPNAKSAPSRAVCLTGRYSWQLGTGGNHITDFPAEHMTIPEALERNGYQIGYTGKGWAPGNPGILEDGSPRLLTGKNWSDITLTPPARFISNIDYASNFIAFLDDATANGKPWMFWVGTREPHRKYEFGVGLAKGGKTLDMIDRVPEYWPDNDTVRTDLLDYGYEIEYQDKHLLRIIEELDERGKLDNTLIIVTADNGMPFPRAKANNYEQSHHQPLAIMWGKGIKGSGRRVKDIVNFVDFAPTIAEVAGIDARATGMSEFSGESLLRIFRSSRNGRICKNRDCLIVGRERDDYGRPANQGYPIRGIMRDGMLYIWNMRPDLWPACNPEIGFCEIDGSPTKSVILDMHRAGDDYYFNLSMGHRPEEEMFNVSVDPDCMRNLAGDPEYAAVKESLKAELTAVLRSQNDPRLCGDPDVFDKYPYALPQDWDFFEKVKNGEIKAPWEITDWIEPTDYDEYVRLVKEGKIEEMSEITKGLNW